MTNPNGAARLLIAVAVAGNMTMAANVARAQSLPTSSTSPATAPVDDANDVRLPRFPAVSPDGASVAFCWHGDVWTAPVAGGRARRLTVDPADDLFPVFSPDGARLAFASERVGGGNLFTMRVDGTDVRQLTTTDRYFVPSDWADGRIYASAKLEPETFPGGRSYGVPDVGGDASRAFDAFGTRPAVSSDGSKVLFERGAASWSRRGYRGSDARDVWLYDRAAKSYRQLTDWPGNDGRARWVDDQTFVYASDREDDTVNLYLARLDDRSGLATVRLTRAVGVDVEDFAVSRDGRTLVYAQWDRLYRIDLSDRAAAPAPIAIDAEQDAAAARTTYRAIDRSVTEAALSPDGRTMAVVAFGQVWVRGVDVHSATRLVDARFARCRDLAWSPDGARLYYASDATGHDAIYTATVDLARSDVKRAATQRSAATSPSGTGFQPVWAATRPAEHGLKTHATTSVAAATRPADRGLVVPATNPATTRALATTRAVAPPYVDRWPDAVRFRVEALVDSGAGDVAPSPSPDGKSLAFQRGNGQLWVRDLATGRERILFDGWSDALEWQWSPDATRVAFVTEDKDNNRDVFLVPADGLRPPVNLSKHPDNDYRPRFSADGKVLVFLSQRAGNESDVYRLFLDRDLESLGGVDLDQYYKQAAEAAKRRKRPTPSDARPSTRPSTTRSTTRPATRRASTTDPLDDAYLRVTKLASLPGDEGDLEITPAGDRVIFTAQNAIGTGRSIYTVYRDGEPQRIQGEVNVGGLTFDGDRAVGVTGGRAATINVASGELQFVDVSGRLPVDRRALYQQEINEAARLLGAQYYDATMNGLDWPAVARRYAKLMRDAATPGEFDHVAAKLVGEVNGSHLGIDMPNPPNANAINVGRLGARLARVADGYEVKAVYPNGPAATGAFRLVPGDVIIGVEGEAFNDATRTLDAAMVNRVGVETLVSVRRGGRSLDVLLLPIAYAGEADLAYDAWRNAAARRVAELSKGRLGYIHIRGMNQPSLETFERDLFAAADGRDGLIIDVRNNGGGWTTDRLLTSILAPDHAYTRPRGFQGDARGAYPVDRLFIQRYTLPIDMLCNEKSFSNAEIVAHAFQTMRRGTLVGETTAGGVISTGGTTLLDGTSVRLPTRGWYLPDGTNMEQHGARPDVRAPMRPADEAADDDVQLKAAVDDLMARIDATN